MQKIKEWLAWLKKATPITLALRSNTALFSGAQGAKKRGGEDAELSQTTK